jgi:hypothetical protein
MSILNQMYEIALKAYFGFAHLFGHHDKVFMLQYSGFCPITWIFGCYTILHKVKHVRSDMTALNQNALLR